MKIIVQAFLVSLTTSVLHIWSNKLRLCFKHYKKYLKSIFFCTSSLSLSHKWWFNSFHPFTLAPWSVFLFCAPGNEWWPYWQLRFLWYQCTDLAPAWISLEVKYRSHNSLKVLLVKFFYKFWSQWMTSDSQQFFGPVSQQVSLMFSDSYACLFK